MSSSRFEMVVPVVTADIDEQNHVNNTVYLRWIQDVATAHWRAIASRQAQRGRITLWRVLIFEIARGRDWFRSSARVLFGDPALRVFPLGRLVLQVTTGRRAAGKYSQHQ